MPQHLFSSPPALNRMAKKAMKAAAKHEDEAPKKAMKAMKAKKA